MLEGGRRGRRGEEWYMLYNGCVKRREEGGEGGGWG